MFACLYRPPPIDPASAESLLTIARDFSPRVESREPGLVLIDLSGLERLLGDPHTIAMELQRACATHPTQMAMAQTRVAAQLLAQTRQAPADPLDDNIGLLPLASLARMNAPPDLLETLERWGLRTLGDFAALAAAPVSARLGQDGLQWHRTARGDDVAPLVPTPPDERFEETIDLEWPIEGIEPLAFVLGPPLDRLCTRLELRDRAVAVIEMRLRTVVSRAWQVRRLELPTPMRDPRMLRTLLCLDLEGHPDLLTTPDGPGSTVVGIDRLGIFIEPTAGRIEQYSLIAKPSVAPELIATLMARLHALMGQDRCGRASLVDTHRPGAFEMEVFTGEHPHPPPQPRRAPTRGLRRLRHPIPARVLVEHGRPCRVTTDRRGWSGGTVTWCAGPWRVSGDWWREKRPAPSLFLYDWEEWDVSLTDGASYRIHEDRDTVRWFINAVLD